MTNWIKWATSMLSVSVCICNLYGQNWQSAFDFLKIPKSSHITALGGNAISLKNSDPSILHSNPASLTNIQSQYVGLNLMNYIAHTKMAGVEYLNPYTDRATYAIFINYVDYGKMKHSDNVGNINNQYSAKDIYVGGAYAYKLGDQWGGGVTGKIIYSRYYSYSSVATAVDLGIYRDFMRGRVAIAATNLGGQIKPFENQFEKLPFNLTASASWQLDYAPLRFTLSMNNLTRWRDSDFFHLGEKNSAFNIFLKHLSGGADILLSDQIYISFGCNLLHRAELAAQGGRGLTGLSIGSGVELQRVIFSVSYSQFQISTSSLLLNFAYKLQ